MEQDYSVRFQANCRSDEGNRYYDFECSRPIGDEAVCVKLHPTVFIDFNARNSLQAMVDDYLLTHERKRSDLNYATKIMIPWNEHDGYSVEFEWSVTPVRIWNPNRYRKSLLTYEVSTDVNNKAFYKPIKNELFHFGEGLRRFWCGIPFEGDNFNYCISLQAEPISDDIYDEFDPDANPENQPPCRYDILYDGECA